MQCPRYSHIVNDFFQMFKNSVRIFLLNSKLQLNWLLENSDDLVILQLANFIYIFFLKFMVNEYLCTTLMIEIYIKL